MSKVVNGIATLEDSCMASVKMHDRRGVWSPCGRLIATYIARSGVGTVTVNVRDPNTLEMVSTLEPPVDHPKWSYRSVAFSSDGRLLACGYLW